MRYLFLFFTVSLLFIRCSQQDTQQEWIIIDNYETGNPKSQRSLDLNADSTYNYRELYPSGKIKITGKKKNEKRVGLWKSFYEEDEQLWSIGDYTDGIRNGRSIIYHQNGNLWMSGYYKNDKLDGIWVTLNNEGDTLNISEYKDGTVIFSSQKQLEAPLR